MKLRGQEAYVSSVNPAKREPAGYSRRFAQTELVSTLCRIQPVRCLCLDCGGFASPIRRANALCTLLGAATSRCHSRSIALPIRSAGAFWCCVCARDRLRLAFADNPNLPFRVFATTGGGGDTCCISTWKFVVSVRAGVTNDVATSEVATVL